MYFNQKKYIIPNDNKSFNFEHDDNIECIQIAEGSVLKCINFCSNPNIKRIEFPNGTIDIDEALLGKLHINKNSCIIRLQEGNMYKYKILDKDKFQTLQEGRMNFGSYGEIYEDSVFIYNSIYDVDTTKFDEDNDIYFYFQDVDENYWFNNGYGMFKGQIYTKNEVQEIQKIIYEIVGKVNVPPKDISDREKIIYAQIIKNLNEYLTLDYDYETFNLIENAKKSNNISYQTMHEENSCQIDESQNLKGLLKGKTVCAGFATIVQTLCQYFEINCKVITNDEHAWNLVELDGNYYEDDFSWYKDNLQASDIVGMEMFLKGKNKNGERTFGNVKDHQLDGDIPELSEDIDINERFNLLTTDWANIKDWNDVDITKPSFIRFRNGFLEQFRNTAESKRTICLVALKKMKNMCISSSKKFIEKIEEFLHGEQDR